MAETPSPLNSKFFQKTALDSKNLMRKIVSQVRSEPVLLFGVVLICYGIYIPWFGFYGDDWSYIWYHQLLGFSGPGQFASFDRPFSSLFYNLAISILGESPWPYHVFLLMLRWLSAVTFWWVLRMIWPQKKRALLWIAILFAVYPGFTQQPIAVEYILHFSVLDLFLISLGGMMRSLQVAKKWFWPITVGSMLFSASMFSMEYFIGLELLRPILIWLLLQKQELASRRRFTRTLFVWFPYLIVLIIFLGWRVFFFEFPTYTPTILEDLKTAPFETAAQLGKTILLDFKTVAVDAWRQVLRLQRDSISMIYYFFLVIISFFSIIFLIKKISKDDSELFQGEDSGIPFWKDWSFQPIALGVFSILAAGWPFWVTGIQIELGFPWDRPTLPFMPGVSLLVVGLSELLIRARYRIWILAVLFSFAVGMHYQNAVVYRDEWNNLRDFYWQLSWRVPALKEGTILVSDDIPLYRVGDSALTAPLNWTYAPNHTSNQLPYKLFDLTVRLRTVYSGLPGLQEGLPITHNYRSTLFSSSTSNLIIFYYNTQKCMRLLYPEDALLPGLPPKVLETIHLSKPELILVNTGSSAKPPTFMGPEPEHSWCYYFQKAELARQMEDWQQIVDLGEDVFSQSLVPKDISELQPYIEGYAQTRNWEKAKELTEMMFSDKSLQPILCAVWSEIGQGLELEEQEQTFIISLKSELGCTI